MVSENVKYGSVLFYVSLRKLHNGLSFRVPFAKLTIQTLSENDITEKRIKENYFLC